MLTVLIETLDDEEGLARTLASLVGGAVEGVVREVVVCDRGSKDQTHYVAEHAGCGYLAEGGIAAGIRQARGDWLLVLEPGARLAEGWSDSVVAHVSASQAPARFSPAGHRRASTLSRILSRPTALSLGLLISRKQAMSRGSGNAEALARGLRLSRLDGEISAAPRRPQ
jgi:hypothetical protein